MDVAKPICARTNPRPTVLGRRILRFKSGSWRASSVERGYRREKMGSDALAIVWWSRCSVPSLLGHQLARRRRCVVGGQALNQFTAVARRRGT